MIDLLVQRRGVSLLPVSGSDEREVLRLPERRIISIQADVHAPPKVSRWYRAAVQILAEGTGRWPTREIAHREIMIRSGYFESFVTSTDGDVRFTPQSTQGWGLVEWREYLDAAMPVMIEFAGETHAKYRDRVDAMLGIKLKEAWE